MMCTKIRWCKFYGSSEFINGCPVLQYINTVDDICEDK